MKYFLELAYDGSRYHGWQRQKNAPTVQAAFETHLSRVLKQKTHVIGCGRTDTGVHASQYFAHIKVADPLSEAFQFRLNKALPPDIALLDIIEVPLTAHAQHDATSRTYTYHLHQHKHPYLSRYSTEFDLSEINDDRMQAAIDHLLNTKDFRSMCRNPNVYKSTACAFTSMTLTRHGQDQRLTFQFTADRFLRAMVRLLVARILKVGTGRMDLEQFKDLVDSGEAFPHFDPAPPQGLHLTQVAYPYLTSNAQEGALGLFWIVMKDRKLFRAHGLMVTKYMATSPLPLV